MVVRFVGGKKRDYAKETAYENRPEQVKRRVARNKARRKALKEGRVHKGDDKELGHVNAPRTGSLDRVPVRVISRVANRKDQPDRPGGKRKKRK